MTPEQQKRVGKIEDKIDDLLWAKCLVDTALIRHQILSIEGIEITDTDQSLPENLYATLGDYQVCCRAQRQMQRADWKKIIPKPYKEG